MKVENVVFIMETKKNIEFNISIEKNDRAKYRMQQALHYIEGAIKAVEVGMDERAWFAVDKANWWMSEARKMAY